MTVYKTRIAQQSGHNPPRAEIYIACTRADCRSEYHMPAPGMRLRDYPAEWLDSNRPCWDDIDKYAAQWAWTFTDEHGPRCPEHRHGKPIGELEAAGTAHRREQAVTDTAEIDVTQVRAALAEEDTNDE